MRYVLVQSDYTCRLLEPRYDFVNRCKQIDWTPLYIVDKLWGRHEQTVDINGFAKFPGVEVNDDEIDLTKKLFAEEMKEHDTHGGYVIFRDTEESGCSMVNLFLFLKKVGYCCMFDIEKLNYRLMDVNNDKHLVNIMEIASESG